MKKIIQKEMNDFLKFLEDHPKSTIVEIKAIEEKMNEKINPIEETARNKKELETLASKLKK